MTSARPIPNLASLPSPRPIVRAVFLGVALLWNFWPAVALAHAYPVRSSPAANSSVGQSPRRVEIWFSESLEPRLSNLVVYDDVKRNVATGPSQVDPADSTVLVVGLPSKLPSGTYTVVWHVVSADDGHSTAGVFAFGVGVPASVPVIAPRQLDAVNGQAATPIGVLGRWLTYLGVSVIVGTAFFAFFIDRSWTPKSSRDSDDPAARWLHLLIRGALLVLVVGQVLRLFDEVSLASAQGAVAQSAEKVAGVVVFGSRFGAMWLARFALAGLAVVLEVNVQRARRSPRWIWLGLLAVGFGLITDVAWSGHAASGNLLAYVALVQTTIGWGAASPLYLRVATVVIQLAKLLTLLMDWLHLASVAVWLGGLLALAGLARTMSRSEGSVHTDRFGSIIAKFSRLAGWAMLIVVGTGLYNTWLYLAGPTSYLSTGYGRGLLLKHVFVVGVLLIAAINHFLTVPVITTGRPRGRWPGDVQAFFTRHSVGLLWSEAALGVLVLLSTGLLTSLGPARTPWQILADPARVLGLAGAPFAEPLRTDRGQSVGLGIDPGRTGLNRFVVTLKGDATASPVDRAYLELTPDDLSFSAQGPKDILSLTRSNDGTFSAKALIPGAFAIWQAQLLLYHVNGSIGTATTAFQMTHAGAAPVDSTAKALLARAAGVMEGLHTVRMTESLSDGAGGLVLSSYRFAAPDVEEIQTPAGESVIHQGGTVYQGSVASEHWEMFSGASVYAWPTGDFDYLKTGKGAITVGHATLDGQVCSIVAFYAPASQAIYEEWIAADGRIRQEVMAAPSHFMVDRYFAFNRPDTIQIPTGRSGG